MGVRVDKNEELKFLVKFKNLFFWGGGGRGGRVVGGQGGFGRRIEVFVKIQKKKWGGGVRRGGVRWGVGLVGVRVDVNEELKFLGKFKKKIGGGGVIGGGGGGRERGWGSGWM